jgi:hypothetical protein
MYGEELYGEISRVHALFEDIQTTLKEQTMTNLNCRTEPAETCLTDVDNSFAALELSSKAWLGFFT